MASLRTEDIECLLQCLVHGRMQVLGVHPADVVPLRRTANVIYLIDNTPLRINAKCCFVLNTHPHNGPGEHWLAFYYHDGVLEYFDSFGLALETYSFVYASLADCGLTEICVRANCFGMLQSPSTSVCGHYCVMFLCWCTKYKPVVFSTFVRSSTTRDDPLQRDKFIVQHVRTLIDRSSCCSTFACVPVKPGSQCCTCRTI